MASSENLLAMEQPFTFRPTFADSWISDIFSKETETLTKALQKSFAPSPSNSLTDDVLASFLAKPETTPPPPPQVQTPTVSGGSENDSAVAPKRKNSVGPTGKPTKRKSRASKRATTTFITADPANFRQMVQQVTGIRFGGLNGQLAVPPVLKPEPQRAVNPLQPGGCLPTLDTSAFLLDTIHQQQVASTSSLMAPPPPASVPPPSTSVMVDCGSSGFDFDSFCSFPTLESWKAM